MNNLFSSIQQNLQQNMSIYSNPLYQPYPNGNCSFIVGDYVYAIQTGNSFYTRALVTDINNGVYTIQFDNGTIQLVNNVTDLQVYYPCNCNSQGGVISIPSGYLAANSSTLENCSFLTSQLLGNLPAL